jgi:tetratricopeptide (TPR) repeat protein/energy-coupling factor transporter ATP-binding protein EcfA2
MTDSSTGFNPFPGLRHFEMTEAHLFFGREGQSDELLRRLRENRFLAVLGTSGTGKSSLIRAGLLPSLFGGMTTAGSRWRVAIFRPGNDPIGNLARALSEPDVLGGERSSEDAPEFHRMFIEAALSRSAIGLVEVVRQAKLSTQENLLVVVDQFEELFRFRSSMLTDTAEDEAAAFVKLLLEATRESGMPIYVVITMRSDFIGDCSRFRDLPEALNNGIYLIPRMTRDQRQQAITGPIAVAGGAISPRLVSRLLNEAGEDPAQLPILQHALMRTWNCWQNDHGTGEPIDFRHYDAIGGMQNALSQHADEVYNELPDAGSRSLAERLFQCLTEKGPDNREMRRPATVATVAAVAETGVGEVIAVVEYFRRPGCSFLMPPAKVPLTGESLVDISHESLIRGWNRLEQWVAKESEWAGIYRRLAETAVLFRQSRAALWRNPDLEIASQWRRQARPNRAWAERYSPEFEAAIDFLEASTAADEAETRAAELNRLRELRRTRVFAGVLLVAFLVTLALGWKFRTEKAIAAANGQMADENLKTANKNLLTANENAKRADQNLATANENLKRADDALERANEEREDLHLQTLDTRVDALGANSNLKSTVDNLIDASSPLLAAYYHAEKGAALSNMGDHAAAVEEYTHALDGDPEYLSARFSRGYEYLLVDKPAEAEKDIKVFIQAEPNDGATYLNLAITQAMMGKYDLALDSARKAEKRFRYENLSEIDSEVSPDLQDATGRRVLRAHDGEFHSALFYEIASLEASKGGDGFERALREADCHAILSEEANCQTSQWTCEDAAQRAMQGTATTNPFILALNWTWLHYRARTGDYGALGAMGALWERAACFRPDFNGWALHYYLAFEQERQEAHKNRQDARYLRLAGFVHSRIELLRSRGTVAAVPDIGQDDPLTLSVTAQELRANTSSNPLAYVKINRLLTEALRQAEKKRQMEFVIDLLIERSDARIKAQDFDGARSDCAQILKLAPHKAAVAYLMLARIARDSNNQNRNEPDAIKNYQKVLELERSNGGALSGLAYLLEKSDSERALDYAQRALRQFPSDDGLYALRARIFQEKKSYQQALQAISIAIAIKPEKYDYYDLRQELERAQGQESKADITLRQVEGYETVTRILARKGNASGTLDGYVRSLELLRAAKTNSPEDPVQWRAVFLMRELEDFLEAHGNQQSTITFWDQLRRANYLDGYIAPVQQEVDRLTTHQWAAAK